MNGLNGELMVALSEIPMPSDAPDSAFSHLAVAIAFLAKHPEYAARFGQVLTEHTAPPEDELLKIGAVENEWLELSPYASDLLRELGAGGPIGYHASAMSIKGNALWTLGELGLVTVSADSIVPTWRITEKGRQWLEAHPSDVAEIPKRSPAQRIGLNGPSGTAVVIIPIQRGDGLTTKAHIQLTVPQINALAACAAGGSLTGGIRLVTLDSLEARGLIDDNRNATDLGLQWLSRAGLGDG